MAPVRGGGQVLPADRIQEQAPEGTEAGKGRKILKGIHFFQGTDSLRPESNFAIDLLCEDLSNEPSLTIEISAHLDPGDCPGGCRELTRRMAMRIRDHLVECGIPKSNMIAVGRGTEAPLDRGQSFSAKERNRRVEIRSLQRPNQARPILPDTFDPSQFE